MERIGIYGGTFNPPHIGHLQAAKQAITSLNLDRLLLIPDRIAPHKEIPSGSPTPQQRMDMLRIAAENSPGLEVSDIELRREGVSYTYLTVEELKKQHPDAELVLLMGTDMFLSFHTWKHPEKILENASLGIFCRGEKGERAAIEARKAEMEAEGACVELVNNDVIHISSTQMRRLLAFRCAGAFLPEGVLEYIRENKLYDTRTDWKNLPMEELEPIVEKYQKIPTCAPSDAGDGLYKLQRDIPNNVVRQVIKYGRRYRFYQHRRYRYHRKRYPKDRRRFRSYVYHCKRKR